MEERKLGIKEFINLGINTSGCIAFREIVCKYPALRRVVYSQFLNSKIEHLTSPTTGLTS